MLADEQAYTLVLDGEDDLAGLPDFVRAAAAAPRPRSAGLTGKHVITLSRSSVEPFLQFSPRRDLREKAFRAWIARGDSGGATDNKAIIAETVALRAERARLLGYPTFAHYRLDDAMAKTPEAVRGLLEQVWAPARSRAHRRSRRAAGADRRRRAAISSSRRGTGATTPRSCASARCDFDEAEIKPYFQLDRIIEAAFYTAQRLFGLTFDAATTSRSGIPTCGSWEVRGRRRQPSSAYSSATISRGRSKRGGAWMTTLRDQEKLDGDVRPLVVNVMNFTKAARRADAAVVRRRPHAVPRVRPRAARRCSPTSPIPMVSGTSVLTDCVELPSQLYEHWLEQPEMLQQLRPSTTGPASRCRRSCCDG